MGSNSDARAASDSTRARLTVAGRDYAIYEIPAALGALPVSHKILLENALRHGRASLSAFEGWLAQGGHSEAEIDTRLGRVLVHDMNCVPAIADFATLREAMQAFGGDPASVNPKVPVDIVVDHSTIVDFAGTADAFQRNLDREFERNSERFAFIRWAQQSLANLRVIPPGSGILHQINIEHLTDVVCCEGEGDEALLVPDTLVGTDSHTTMVNALGVLGWGVGGIEAQAAALGDSLTLRLPDVTGVRLVGRLRPGVNATDLALTLTHFLRKLGVVEKIVEFFGPGVATLAVVDRATVSNMAPEYGAMCSMFPIDAQTLRYLELIGHEPEHVARVEAYARRQGLWSDGAERTVYTDTVDFDLASVETSLAGPRRPQDRVELTQVKASFLAALPDMSGDGATQPRTVPVAGKDFTLTDGAVLIAAITSCTNTSNPALMIGAGLVARKARQAGLAVPPWVKTSLSPGSLTVADYLTHSGLQEDLDALGFQVTGFGCMTCNGNSGDLDPAFTQLTKAQQLVGAAVLSGNRNFENRVNSAIRAAYLASPPLVVAYALAGTVLADMRGQIGIGRDGKPVTLAHIWPSDDEVAAVMRGSVHRKVFADRFRNIFSGPASWSKLKAEKSVLWRWDPESTYIKRPPYFEGMERHVPRLRDIEGARAIVIVGDSTTTDHISPVGSIEQGTLAGDYLSERNVPARDYNQFGTRRGNHEVMMRGVFSNPRLCNEILESEGIRGGMTRMQPTGEIVSVYDAAMAYARQGTPLIVVAGKEYGTGSSRDWAAKGPQLIGVRAIVAESFERIHRINLIGTGVLPLQFIGGVTRKDLHLDGSETFDLVGLSEVDDLRPRIGLRIRRADGTSSSVDVLCRIETSTELAHLNHGGLLRHVLRDMLPAETA